jgi:hypothetical protein
MTDDGDIQVAALNGGTGTSSASRQQVVFFVTDGVSDGRQTSCMKTYVDQDRCIQPIDVSQCTALKNRNIKIAIVYTTYVPLTGDHLWIAISPPLPLRSGRCSNNAPLTASTSFILPRKFYF